MSELDDLFRAGLGDRRPPVSSDLWRNIAARKTPVPGGEALDRLFATTLADRQATVPPGMWARIVAARRGSGVAWRGSAAAILLLLLGGAGYLLFPSPAPGKAESGDGAQVQTRSDQLREARDAGVTAPVPPGNTGSSAAAITLASLPSAPEAVIAMIPSFGVNSPDPGTGKISDSPARSIAVLDGIPTLPVSALALGPYELSPPPPSAPVDRRSFRGSDRHRFGTELLLGAAYAGQQLGLRDEAGRELLDAREISEFPEVSFQLSGRLRYRLTSRFNILTGLSYVQLRNQLEYETVRGGFAELVRSNNRFHLLEVPLLLSYSLPGRRLRLNLNAGPILNVFTGTGGRYVNPDSAVPIRLRDSGLYRSNTGLGWMTSLTTTYVIGKQRNVQLLLEPFFKQYAGSFTHPRADLTETYWMGGLQLGLRKQF